MTNGNWGIAVFLPGSGEPSLLRGSIVQFTRDDCHRSIWNAQALVKLLPTNLSWLICRIMFFGKPANSNYPHLKIIINSYLNSASQIQYLQAKIWSSRIFGFTPGPKIPSSSWAMAIMDSCSSHDLSSHGWPIPWKRRIVYFPQFRSNPNHASLRCLNRAWQNYFVKKRDVWKNTVMQLVWLDGKDMNGMISNTNCELMELAKSPISLCRGNYANHTRQKSGFVIFSTQLFPSKKIWDKRLLWITKNKLLDLLELMHSEDATNVSTLYRGIVQDIPRLKCKFPIKQWHELTIHIYLYTL